jgi:hypothetical protein
MVLHDRAVWGGFWGAIRGLYQAFDHLEYRCRQGGRLPSCPGAHAPFPYKSFVEAGTIAKNQHFSLRCIINYLGMALYRSSGRGLFRCGTIIHVMALNVPKLTKPWIMGSTC